MRDGHVAMLDIHRPLPTSQSLVYLQLAATKRLRAHRP